MHWSELIALINWNLFAWFGIVHVTRCGQIQANLIVQTQLLVWGSLLRQYLIQTNRNRALKLFRGHFWVMIRRGLSKDKCWLIIRTEQLIFVGCGKNVGTTLQMNRQMFCPLYDMSVLRASFRWYKRLRKTYFQNFSN